MPVAYEFSPSVDAFAAMAEQPPAVAPVPRLPVVGIAAHARLLESVAALTHHRDIDALDISLALSLAELTAAHAVSLCKRAADSTQGIESIMRCATDEHGGFAISTATPDPGDPAHGPLWECMDDQGVHADVDAYGVHRLFVPILHEGRALGALQLETSAPLGGAHALAEGFACIYANYLTLLNESERDKLTGLYNRRTFERHLQRLFARSAATEPAALDDATHGGRRATAPASDTAVWLAIFDIDHFKRVNDTYGHIYGDEVILLLAQQMRTCFRRSDVLFRFGGEEFVVLLTDTSEADARLVLERFRTHVSEYLFPQVGHVTVSVGYARANMHDYPEKVVDCADKALYFAKQNGRNCTYGYEELLAGGALETVVVNTGSIDLF